MDISAAAQEQEQTRTTQDRTERQLVSSSWAITVPAFSGLCRAMQESAQRESDFQTHQAYHAAIHSGALFSSHIAKQIQVPADFKYRVVVRLYAVTIIAGFSPRASASLTSVVIVRLSPGISAT